MYSYAKQPGAGPLAVNVAVISSQGAEMAEDQTMPFWPPLMEMANTQRAIAVVMTTDIQVIGNTLFSPLIPTPFSGHTRVSVICRPVTRLLVIQVDAMITCSLHAMLSRRLSTETSRQVHRPVAAHLNGRRLIRRF